MTHITKRFDTQEEALDWITDASTLTRRELYVEHGSEELYIEAHYPEGHYSAECGEAEVEYYTRGGDLNGRYSRVITEWRFSPIDHYPLKMPSYISPLNELFASFNNIFGGKR